MNLVLPEPVRQWVEAQAARSGQPPEAFVLRVLYERIHRDPLGDEEEYDDEPEESNGQPPTAEEVATARRILEMKLQEAIDSGPPILVTPEFWAERRRILAERLAAQTQKTP